MTENHRAGATCRTVSSRPKKNSYWRKFGGGSLTISIFVHLVFLIIATLWIIRTFPEPPPRRVDFLPSSGGGGSPASDKRSLQKQKAALMRQNVGRISVMDAHSVIALPEMDASSALSSIHSVSGSISGGLGGSGSGGGRGSGQGKGFGSGNGLGANSLGGKPIVMFGLELDAKKIGVVMDVSASMAPYLTRVIEELDKVSAGSPVVLYRGCGLSPQKNRKIDDHAKPTGGAGKRSNEDFEEFWRIVQSPGNQYKGSEIRRERETKTPIPHESIYHLMSGRMNTFYINEVKSVGFAAAALTARELRNVDTIYWFADFQDKVTEPQMKEVLGIFRERRQKLYLHASIKGRYREEIRDQLAVPSGGKLIEVKILGEKKRSKRKPEP